MEFIVAHIDLNYTIETSLYKTKGMLNKNSEITKTNHVEK